MADDQAVAELPGRRTGARRRGLSRGSGGLGSAPVLGGRRAHRDAEHPGRIRSRGPGPGGAHASDRRGVAPRLSRPRALSGRPRLRIHAARATPGQALRRGRGNGPYVWVSSPRFHHQYLPDRVEYEPGALDERERAGLRRRGHRLFELREPYGNMQAVLWDRGLGVLRAASDPRGEGRARVETTGSPQARTRRASRASARPHLRSPGSVHGHLARQ
jgi:hypothetical protein